MDMEAISQKKPLDYVKIAFRRKWFLIIPVVIGIIGGIIAANTLPKIYEASTLILVEEDRVINPLVQDLAVSTSTTQRLMVLREQILGWDRINQLISGLNLAKDIRTQQEFENLVKKLRANIKVNLHEQNIIRISYGGKDPVEAQNIVKTITDIFISENVRQQTKETTDAISFINDQLALYQKKLKQSDVASMEDQLNKLLADSTEKHPLVIDLRKKIAAAKKEFGEGDYGVAASSVAGSDDELKSMREELRKMKEDFAAPNTGTAEGGVNRTKLAEATNDKLYKLLLIDKIDQVTTRDASVHQKLYNTLLERLETAKITERLESSRQGTRYTVLDPVRLPLKPAKPNKPLVLLMGIFMGACAGIGIVFCVEMFDHSFLGVDEAKETLTIPILGAISKIITQEDLEAQKARRTKITGISIATGVVLLVIIIFNVLLGS